MTAERFLAGAEEEDDEEAARMAGAELSVAGLRCGSGDRGRGIQRRLAGAELSVIVCVLRLGVRLVVGGRGAGAD